MSSPTVESLRKLEQTGPAAFLSLAPATSTGYPQAPKTVVDATAPVELKRRSSSMSSTGFRFLKLGPVHFGEHADEQQDDWA